MARSYKTFYLDGTEAGRTNITDLLFIGEAKIEPTTRFIGEAEIEPTTREEKKVADKITITYNGVTLTGTKEDILKLGVKLGPTYQSSTHGEVLIADMNTNHIINALNKLYLEWFNDLKGVTSLGLASAGASETERNNVARSYVQALVGGPKDEVIKNLVAELARRTHARF